MGLLTDISNFLKELGIEFIDATPNHQPAKTPEEKVEKVEETGVEELKPIEPVETEPEPSKIEEPSGVAPIGEQGKADRIATDPEPERAEPEAFHSDVTFRISEGGDVRTSRTGQPVEGVSVQLDVGSCVTDSSGACKIRNVPVGSHQLVLTKSGYKPNTLLFTARPVERQSVSYYIHKEASQ